MKYCPSCRSQIIGDVKYCNECGTNISTIKISTTQQHYPQQYLQHLPPISRPPPKKAITAMVLAIISAIMLIIIGALPWWSVTVDRIDGKEDYTLKEVVAESGDNRLEVDLEDIPNAEFDDVADTTSLILLLSTILMILVIVLIGLLIWFYYNSINGNIRMFQNILRILVIISMIFVIIAPIYYMFAWSMAMDDASGGEYNTFIGSEEIDGYDTRWGPGIGWILAFVCFFLILVTFFFIKQSEKETREIAPSISPNYQIYNLQPPQQPYQQPPPMVTPIQQSDKEPAQQIQKRYCGYCGKQITISSKFCTYCGNETNF